MDPTPLSPPPEAISALENSNINSLAAVKENDKF